MAKNLTMKSKITLTDFKPERLIAAASDVNKLLLGTLIGKATTIVKRMSQDKTQEFLGLGGMFEMHVNDGSEPASSGQLWMPDAFSTPIINMLSDEVNEKTGEVIRQGATAVEIAYQVFAIRANNPAKRSWELMAIRDPKAEEPTDILAGLRQLVAPPAAAVIEDKSKAAKK